MKWSCLINLLTSVSILMPMAVSAETGIDVMEKMAVPAVRSKLRTSTGISPRNRVMRQKSSVPSIPQSRRQTTLSRQTRATRAVMETQKRAVKPRTLRSASARLPRQNQMALVNRTRRVPTVGTEKAIPSPRTVRSAPVMLPKQTQTVRVSRVRSVIVPTTGIQKGMTSARRRNVVLPTVVKQNQPRLQTRARNVVKQPVQAQSVNHDLYIREFLNALKMQNTKIKDLETALGTSIESLVKLFQGMMIVSKEINSPQSRDQVMVPQVDNKSLATAPAPALKTTNQDAQKGKPKNAVDPSFHTALPEDAVKLVKASLKPGQDANGLIKEVEDAANFLHFHLTKKDESAYAMLDRLNGSAGCVADDFYVEYDKEKAKTGREDLQKSVNFFKIYNDALKKIQNFICLKYKVKSIQEIEEAHKKAQANQAKDAKKAKGSEKPKTINELISIQEGGKKTKKPDSNQTTPPNKPTPKKVKIPDALSKMKLKAPTPPHTTSAPADTTGADSSIPVAPLAPPV